MVYCSVPGCEKINKGQKKRFMFSFPKREELLLKWLEAIPNLKRPIKSSWRVCQYHFENEDILEAFSHTIGGEVYLIERERPRLKANVVPTKNLHNQNLALPDRGKNKTKNKLAASRKLEEHSRSLVNVDDEIATDDGRETPCIGEIVEIIQNETISKKKNLRSLLLSAQTEETDMLQETTGKSKSNKKSSSVYKNEEINSDIKIKSKESNFNNNLILPLPPNPTIPILMEGESFDLFDSVFEVVLPTTLWGIHRSPQQKRIMFVCIDEDQLNINKMLTVDNTGDLKIYLATRLIREEHCRTDDLAPEHISEMLEEIDAMRICLGAHLNENCDVVLTNFDNEEQRRHSLCRKCH